MSDTEPVALAAAVVAAVRAVLAALVLLDIVHLTGEQVAGVAFALAAVLDVPAALWARSKVTPVASLTSTATDSHNLPRG